MNTEVSDNDQLRDQIGEAAENKARDWLGLGGITAHRPERDKRGWDFILEYDLKPDTTKSLEQTETVTTCKLQVKGTLSDSGYVDIKLSNWSKMVKHPIPFFVLVVVFEKNDLETVNASYLIHVDEHYISKVLKRLREIPDSERNNLNEKTMRVDWDGKNKLEGPRYGASIGNKIREFIGASFENYIIKKLGWLKQLGYDENPIKGHIAFHCPDDDPSKLYNQLADLAIGVIKELPIDNIAVDEIRFGIPKPIEMVPGVSDNSELEKISISIDPLPVVCQTKVSLSDIRNETIVSITCDTYRASAIFSFLGSQHDKIRLVSPFITFIIEPPVDPQSEHANNRISVQLPDVQKMSLENFLRSTKALKLLQKECKSGLLLNFDFIKKDGDESTKDPRYLSTPVGPYNFNFPPDTDALLSLSERVGYLYRYFELDNLIGVNIVDLFKYNEQYRQLFMLLSEMAMKPSELHITYSNKNCPSGAGKKTACVVSSMGLLGNHLLACIGVITGRSEIIVNETTESCEMLALGNPSYKLIKSYQRLMHDGDNFSIGPLLDDCVTDLFKQDYDIVINAINGKLLMRTNEQSV